MTFVVYGSNGGGCGPGVSYKEKLNNCFSKENSYQERRAGDFLTSWQKKISRPCFFAGIEPDLKYHTSSGRGGSHQDSPATG